VEIGGDMLISESRISNELSLGVIVTEMDFVDEGLFSINSGTSFSSAKVANIISKVWKQYPDYSSEMIKALIVNSAKIPALQLHQSKLFFEDFERPKKLELSIDAIKVYGHGVPNIGRALYPNVNRVLLLDNDEIELNKIIIYEIPVPTDFYEVNGSREISITLSYVPPTDRNKGDAYLGCTIEFDLFRNISLYDLKLLLTKIKHDDDSINTEDEYLSEEYLRRYRAPLEPKISKRSNSTIQKATWKMNNNPKIKDDTLKLVVLCRDKWIYDNAYKQPYAIIATIEHSNEQINLYDQIEQRIVSRESIQINQNMQGIIGEKEKA
jgi:hypothetical protein